MGDHHADTGWDDPACLVYVKSMGGQTPQEDSEVRSKSEWPRPSSRGTEEGQAGYGERLT